MKNTVLISLKPNIMDIAQIYTSYYSKLVRFALGIVDYIEDAENITQDVFTTLIEKKDILCQIENINAYIYRSIRNKCFDHIKNQLVHRNYESVIQLSYEEELRMLHQTSNDFDVNYEEKIEKQVVEAINTLPNRCKEIFLLSRYEGLKYKEISDRLGLSVNTVDVQIGIALKKLRQKLKYTLCA